MPAVEKGVRLAMADGAIAGYPVVDVRVVITDGKSHSVDSKEIAFVTAARKAFVAAVREARPIVLEPVVELEITAADGQVGDITGDLSARRGQVNGTAALGNGQLAVRAQAPLAELSGYQTRLNTLTGGQARYTMSFSHYDAVPPAVQGKLIAQHQVRDEE
jgi:elongation factor G